MRQSKEIKSGNDNVEKSLWLFMPEGIIAESEGFEPPVPRRVQQISSLPRSTTPAALLFLRFVINDQGLMNKSKIVGR